MTKFINFQVSEGLGTEEIEKISKFIEDTVANARKKEVDPKYITYNVSPNAYSARNKYDLAMEEFSGYISKVSRVNKEFTVSSLVHYKFICLDDLMTGMKINPDSIIQTDGLTGEQIKMVLSRVRP